MSVNSNAVPADKCYECAGNHPQWLVLSHGNTCKPLELTFSHLLVREQIWPNPGFFEQLVLFELCGYNPGDRNGIYANWLHKINRRLKDGEIVQHRRSLHH
jgi:hypothetical protein